MQILLTMKNSSTSRNHPVRTARRNAVIARWCPSATTWFPSAEGEEG